MTLSGRIWFAPRHGVRVLRAGYTLIELVIVVMVLGILAGVAVPRYKAALAGVQLEAAAKQLAADLRRAQAVAQATATTVVLSIDPATETYSSATLPDVDRSISTLSENVGARGHGVEIVSSIFGAGTEVTFDFRGEPAEAGAVTLGAGALSAVITVNETGLVEVSL
ncbi:hypothetical protein Spa11_24710 [Botrimarina mediterranea]|uniref:Type II secretion system protein H n=1 Tax=Botrimarina mediterranea TaxID=2528022 RepID=A0A518K902_9BACT|nr:hypothetical protein Spa11_24710 [Botrimarina mediterranea]